MLQGSKNRFYIEERDHEMDVWLRLGKASGFSPPRNLTLVVTVFKKNCYARDPNYRHCRHTDYCIRKQYFCDSHANCAWPAGDSATDEEHCEGGEWVPSGYGDVSSDSALSPSNIPIIIIVVIVVVGVSVVFCVAVRHFIKTFKSEPPPGEPSTTSELASAASSNHRRQQQQQHRRRPEVDVSAPMLQPEGGTASSPSAPPSYDEALKQPAPAVVEHPYPNTLPSSPPPYTEMPETRTGFI